MSERVAVITIKASMMDPKGKLIPRGVVEELNVQIVDNVATFWFKDPRTTERFAKVAMNLERERGANDTLYSERVKKAITQYPGKDREAIRDIILAQLKAMGVNAKEHGKR